MHQHQHHTTTQQGDACSLPPGIGRFDACLAANLLCRVPSPLACLQEIDAALNPGAVLVLTSPFTWLEEYTDRSKWVGGRRDVGGADGRPVRCAEALKATLAGMGYTVLTEGKVGGPLMWSMRGLGLQGGGERLEVAGTGCVQPPSKRLCSPTWRRVRSHP